MNTVRTLILFLFAVTIGGCSSLQAIRNAADVAGVDTDGLVDRLKKAISDVDVEGLAKDQACKLYRTRGKPLAEAAFAHEWPSFEPLWSTAPDPVADRAYCEKLVTDAGARIVTKPMDGAAHAACGVVIYPSDFESRSPEIKAAIACHESLHVLEQKRVGCADWMRLYFATISARVTREGTAYALYAALLERYGWPRAKVDALLMRKAAGFPERYLIPRRVISDECTGRWWADIRGALRERSGR